MIKLPFGVTLLAAVVACAPEHQEKLATDTEVKQASSVEGAVVDELQRALSREDAVVFAERFVRENGYTDAPNRNIKTQLDPESIEWSDSRAEQLELHRNTLRPRAIGIKSTGDGWGVAFESVSYSNSCRVVTMRADGSSIRIEHQDGIWEFWVGFDER